MTTAKSQTESQRCCFWCAKAWIVFGMGLSIALVSVEGLRSSLRSPISFRRIDFYPQIMPPRSFRTRLFDAASEREEEIRKKIEKLKEEGRITGGNKPSPDGLREKKQSAYDDYADKVQGKLGKRRGQMLGFTGDGTKNWNKSRKENKSETTKEFDIDDFIAEEEKLDAKELELGTSSENTSSTQEQDARGRQVSQMDSRGRRVAMIGSLPEEALPPQEPETASASSSIDDDDNKSEKVSINPSLFDLPDTQPDPPEMSEEELVELVAERLAKKRAAEDAEIEAAAKAKREQEALKNAQEKDTESTTTNDNDDTKPKQTTTGVGGSWSKDETQPEADYTPKVGGWGVFARPKSISEAYGGGRRIGAGYDKVDSEAEKLKTQRLLKEYRQKVGIEVPSEKEHAKEIDEALSIGQRAMQRGVYGTAVSALEKVTKWCSTNSKVGSKVYLELAMAYEAVGRTKEASQIYRTLSECRMEDVKYNAKRLLYGLEAMEMMKDVSSDFTRKKTRNAFIDATGLDNFASKFDDVYQTAYVDLDNGYYKKLTESVVRSTREARQILIVAQGKGEVSRTRIVQALRCLSRSFDDLLQMEIESERTQEPTAYLNGKPIEKEPPQSSEFGVQLGAIGDFELLSADEMMERMDGEWRLQLLADKSGDGVSFFNTTSASQTFSMKGMTFFASGPSGLVTEKCSGRIEINPSKRVLTRSEVESSNTGVNGILSMIGGGKNSGFSAAITRQQQIVSVDPLLMITRRARASRNSGDLDKEYFGVWRRVLSEDEGFP